MDLWLFVRKPYHFYFSTLHKLFQQKLFLKSASSDPFALDLPVPFHVSKSDT